jgi:hypothetical protein
MTDIVAAKEDCAICGGKHFPTGTQCPFRLDPCVVCGTPTVWACSDCAIDVGGSVHVCNSASCRDAHELNIHKRGET